MKNKFKLNSILLNAILSVLITVVAIVLSYLLFSSNLQLNIGEIVPDEVFRKVISSFLFVSVISICLTALFLWVMFSLSIVKYIRNFNRIYKVAYKNKITDFDSDNKFYEDYDNIIKNSEEDVSYAYIIVDFSNISEYEKSHGKDKSNSLIMYIGKVISQKIKANDVFAHRNTFEYQILFSCNNENEVMDLIESISTSIKQITFKYGVIPAISNSMDLFECGQIASSLLNEAKSKGKLFKFYRTATFNQELIKKEIEHDMHTALDDGEFYMYLQPKYNLTTNLFCGAEALVRWKKADGTIIPPSNFIKFFEENNFIIKMDLEILRQACTKIKYWFDSGYTPVPISINISNKHVLNNSFVKDIVSIVRKYEIPHNLIEFDISESSICLTVDKLVEVSNNYAGKDLFVSFDEGGETSSAISMLENLPANSIKLNQVFFANAKYNPKVFDAIRNIISAFQKKNIAVVAEGIETEDQVELLKKLNCHIAQGYYFSKPLDSKEFDDLVYRK